MGEAVLAGGDLETDTVVLVAEGSVAGLSAGGCSVSVCVDPGKAVVSGVGSITEEFCTTVEDSAIRLLIVGGSGLGMGFSTGFVRPSLISWTDGK